MLVCGRQPIIIIFITQITISLVLFVVIVLLIEVLAMSLVLMILMCIPMAVFVVYPVGCIDKGEMGESFS